MRDAIHVYDGTFEGLLTCIDRLLDAGAADATLAPAGACAGDLFSLPVPVDTNPQAAARLCDRLARINAHVVRQMLYAFLSEEPDIGGALYAYVHTTLKRGECVDGYMTHPGIRRVVTTARRVGGEAHRLKGLLRFRELRSGPLWAPVEPDAHVVLLLALHFRRRLAAQSWLIHDVKRHVAVEWNGEDLDWLEGEGLRRRVADIRPDELTREEQGYQDLWRTFFRGVAIPERVNPALQRRNMPRRYWKHLVEKAS